MTPLAAALVAPVLLAALIGVLFGVTISHAKQESRAGDHPLMEALIRRRNPLVNIALMLVFWPTLLYALPRLSFAVFEIEDANAYAISGTLQLAAFGVSLLIGERLWKRLNQ